MSIEISTQWVYESQRTQYKACTLTVRQIDEHVIELRFEGKTGEHLSVLCGQHNAYSLVRHLATILELHVED